MTKTIAAFLGVGLLVISNGFADSKDGAPRPSPTASVVAPNGWKLPTAEFRDKMLTKAGLMPKVGEWGSLEKDQLYSTARDSSTGDLVKKYPALSAAKLKTLSKLAKAGAKSKAPNAEGQPKADPDDVIDKIVNLNP